MADPREIARGLTKAQARTLQEAPPSCDEGYKPALALARLGLITRGNARYGVVWLALTDLGREVAAALREAETP